MLIGKNNAGKSSVLSAIELGHAHLAAGNVAGRWNVQRPLDEFTARDTSRRVQIGVEYEWDSELNAQLRRSLQEESPHLDRAGEQLKSYPTLAVIIAGAYRKNRPFLFVEQITAGTLREGDDLRDGCTT